MMKQSIILLLLGALFWGSISVPPPALGTDSSTRRPSLNIEQAIEAALVNNPMIAMAQARVAAAGNRMGQARSGFLPQVDLNGSFQRTTNPMWAFGTKLNQGAIEPADFTPDSLNEPDPINNFGSDVSLGWTLYNGGQIQIGHKQAALGKKIAELNLTRTRQRVISQTAIAYAGLLLAGENLKVVQQTLDTAQTNLKMVESTFKAGVSIKSDVLRAQVRIAKLAQLLALAKSQVETAWARLNTVMGAMTNDRYELASSLVPGQKMEEALSVWIYSALHHRPDLKGMRLQHEVAAKEVQKARGAHLPAINLKGKYEINTEDFDDTTDNYMLAAGLRINLFSGLRLTAREAEARSLLAAAKAQEYQTVLNVRLETESAFQQAKSALLSIDVSRVAVTQAEETLRIITNRYNSGLVTIVSLLDAEVALQQARMNHFNRLHDYRVAMISLMLSAGTIDQQISKLL